MIQAHTAGYIEMTDGCLQLVVRFVLVEEQKPRVACRRDQEMARPLVGTEVEPLVDFLTALVVIHFRLAKGILAYLRSG